MLRINLLPEQETRRRREVVAAPAGISPLTILIIVVYSSLVGGYFYFGVRRPLMNLRQQERTLKEKVDGLDKGIKAYQADSEKLGRIQYMARLMSDIVEALDPPDRLLWSKKLNQISDLKPENVYVSLIRMTEEITEEAKGKPKAAKAPAAKEAAATATAQLLFPPTFQRLEVRAVTDTENASEVFRLQREFHDNLKTGVNKRDNLTTDFFESFDRIEPGNVTRPEVGGRSAYEFSFTLTAKPLIPKTLATSAPIALEKFLPKKAKEGEKEKTAARKRTSEPEE